MPTLRFKKELVANVELAKVWSEFERAFKDSMESKIWPNHLEVVRSEGLRPGNKVLVEYYGPLKIAVKRYYDLISVNPGKSFSYAPRQPHCFSGLAKVEFVSQISGTTRINWSGDYHFKGISLAYLYFRFYFEKRFFGALSHALSLLS